MGVKEIQKEKNEQYEERHALAVERLRGIVTEETVPEKYVPYFQDTALFLLELENVRRKVASGEWERYSLEEMQSLNEILYSDVLGERYGSSYADPACAAEKLGLDLGRLLSLLYAEMRSGIPYAFEERMDYLTILCELFIEVYNCFEGTEEDRAKQIRDTNKGEDTADMFAAPVETKETQITRVENNGHAMAPYMMSVALWVGCIAFSLMYPLTKYSGKLKSGLAWWGSKASVLYLIALLQAAVMIFMLHLCDGFEPVEMGKTLAVACLASVAFMSVMYFFTNTFGKVGSFLMLVFMVIQLAGSVGTYPLELSGSFVPYLHDWVPFTYTVEAFRSTISGGESIQEAVIFLTVLWIVFTLLTILEFQIRTLKMKRGKRTLDNWLEEKGLA